MRWDSFFVTARRRLSRVEGSSPSFSGLGEGETSCLLDSGAGVGFSSTWGLGSSGGGVTLGRRWGGGSIIGLWSSAKCRRRLGGPILHCRQIDDLTDGRGEIRKVLDMETEPESIANRGTSLANGCIAIDNWLSSFSWWGRFSLSLTFSLTSSERRECSVKIPSPVELWVSDPIDGWCCGLQ